MTRTDWKESCSALRHLLKDVPLNGRGTIGNELVQYKFGAFWYSRARMWVIYNGKSGNVIATIKRSGNTLTIRYRPTSKYADILKGRTEGWGGYSIRRVPSNNLGRLRELARNQIGGIVQRAMQERIIQRELQDNPQSADNELVDMLVRDAIRDLRSEPTHTYESVQRHTLAINSWRQHVAEGTDLQTAYFRVVRDLDEDNTPEYLRGWLNRLNPNSIEFAQTVVDYERSQQVREQMQGAMQQYQEGYTVDWQLAPNAVWTTVSGTTSTLVERLQAYTDLTMPRED